MHLASALGTPFIGFLGVIHSRIWKHLGERDQVIYKKIECSPCYRYTRKSECYKGDAEWERLIEVEVVYDAIKQCLGSSSKGE